MRFRRNSQVEAEVPNSSMSDIAFLLLIFFMVTTAFAARKGIDFRLPAPANEEQEIEQQELKAVTIQVQASGRIVVDGIPKNLGDIQSYLKPILAANPKKFVIIQMDMEASYGNMMDVLDELKQADVQNIALPSKQEISSW
ncbi:MAG TPA: biopolymer transporter ExbD [bacterium]|nr:biopolymer transporter ExbD [bacterium]